MADLVTRYIADKRKQMHEELLEKLGLTETVKEYAPEGSTRAEAYEAGFFNDETADGKIRFFRTTKTIPEITDEEYSQLLSIVQYRESQKAPPPEKPYSYRTTAMNKSGECFAARFLSVLAFILWIGGLILAIVIANETVTKIETGYYSTYTTTETHFNWETFFTTLIIYFTAGAFSLCLSELMKNVQTIASAVVGYNTDKVAAAPGKR